MLGDGCGVTPRHVRGVAYGLSIVAFADRSAPVWPSSTSQCVSPKCLGARRFGVWGDQRVTPRDD